MPDIPPVIQASMRFQEQLKRRDAAALKRVISAYRQSYAGLKDKLDLLLKETEGQALTKGQLTRMARYKSLTAQLEEELQALQVLTRNEVRGVTTAGIAQGSRDAAQLISYAAVGSPRLAGGFNRLPVETIQQLLGFLDPEGPLYERLSKYAAVNAQAVADAIIQGVTMGQNPRTIAANVTRNYGMALTDSMRFVRTSQIWSYREATRANYIANSDIIEGWYWHAALDDRTCASCISLHGTGPYPLDQPLNDHHNGRCAMIPAIEGLGNPIEMDGETWFGEQPEAKQKGIMGKGKFEAWQGGKFQFGQLSAERADDIYGLMRGEATLKELIGE